MGSQVVEIVVWLLSFGVCSILLGTMFQVIRGWLHGNLDAWQDKYLKNNNEKTNK